MKKIRYYLYLFFEDVGIGSLLIIFSFIIAFIGIILFGGK